MEQNSDPILAAASLVLGFVALAVTMRPFDPLSSSEYQAFLLAEHIASNVNALSSLPDGVGRAELTQKGVFDVRILYYDPNIFPIEQIKNTWKEIVSDDLTLGKKGYYVVVTPYEGETPKRSQAAFILAYPQKQETGLEAFFQKTATVCVETIARRAAVKLC